MWSCSTSRLTMASDRLGSPPSSTWNNRTGCPSTPPRALTSATHARAPSAIGAIAAPITPDSAPTDPSLISALGATDAGPGSAPAVDLVTPDGPVAGVEVAALVATVVVVTGPGAGLAPPTAAAGVPAPPDGPGRVPAGDDTT